MKITKDTVLWGITACALAAVGYVFLIAGYSTEATTRVAADSDARMGLISDGEPVDLAAFARPTGYTIFDFMSPT